MNLLKNSISNGKNIQKTKDILERAIFLSIGKNDVNELKKHLSLYPLKIMERKLSDKLLLKLLRMARDFNNIEIGKILLRQWEDYNSISIPISTYLFSLNGLDIYDDYFQGRTIYEFIANISDLTMLNHIYNIFYLDSESKTYITCKNLWDSYPKLTMNEIEELIYDVRIRRLDDDSVNIYIVDFMKEKLFPLMEYQNVPDYIISGERENNELISSLKYIIELNIKDEPPDFHTEFELIEFLADTFELEDKLNVDIDDLLERFNMLTEKEKTDLLKGKYINIQLLNLYNDKELFRILGPSHPASYRNLKIESINECEMYGGDRMFICKENEFSDNSYYMDDDFYEINIVDWFTGNCFICYKKILYKHYAVRLPLTLGGWRGCYCSWNCVRIDVRTDQDEIPEIVFNYIDILEEKFLKIGIYERMYNNIKKTKNNVKFEDIVELMNDTEEPKKEIFVHTIPDNNYLPYELEEYKVEDINIDDEFNKFIEF